jgi:hypothetical protein
MAQHKRLAMNKPLALMLLLLGSGGALTPAPAQGAVETIYSDAQRQRDLTASRQMVETMLAPSFSVENQYARWKRPVCPHVYGLTPLAAWQVEHRIREVADQVGAPVDRADSCIPNIGIIFTVQPQASLLSIADKRPFLLQGGSQKLSVRYPVEAWYATFRVDYDGFRDIDLPWDVTDPWREGCSSNGCDVPQVRGNDSKLHTGLTVEMGAATVLVDSKAVTGMTLGEMGDYLALMTLAQASQFGACQPMPTIANLMLGDCGAQDTPHGLSHVDIALLTALYEVPDSPELLQKQRIVGAMRRSLEAQFGRD